MEVPQGMELTNTNRSRAYPKKAKEAGCGNAAAEIAGIASKALLASSEVSVPVFRVQAALKERKAWFLAEACETFGDDGEGEPRVPISNTAVKPFSANGT